MSVNEKSDHCWSCGTHLDPPFEGRRPESHGCIDRQCVVCPRCNEPRCACSKAKKAEKRNRIKTLIMPAPANGVQAKHPSTKTAQKHDAETVPLPAIEPFPCEVLPSILERFVAEGAVALACPPDFLAVPLLVLSGLAIGATRRIEVKQDWSESAALFAAVIGSPGSAKSPALKRVLEALERLQLEWEEEFDRQCAQGGPEARAFDGAYPPPKLRRCLTTDATCESLALLLADNPRGIGMIRDELVALVKSMNMYRKGKGADREFYMSAFSGMTIRIDRKANQNGKPIRIPSPFLCVCGGLVPDQLDTLADDDGRADGFIDRILFSYPDPRPVGKWNESVISPEAREGWKSVVEKLMSLAFAPDCAGRESAIMLPMTTQAKDVWREFFDAWELEMSVRGSLAGTWSKLKGYCARLALILQLLRWACGEASEDEVDEVSVRGAVTLTQYFASHAERVRAAMGRKNPDGDEETKADALLLEALQAVLAANNGHWEGD